MKTHRQRIDDLNAAIEVHLTFRDPEHWRVQRLRMQIKLEERMHRAPLIVRA